MAIVFKNNTHNNIGCHGKPLKEDCDAIYVLWMLNVHCADVLCRRQILTSISFLLFYKGGWLSIPACTGWKASEQAASTISTRSLSLESTRPFRVWNSINRHLSEGEREVRHVEDTDMVRTHRKWRAFFCEALTTGALWKEKQNRLELNIRSHSVDTDTQH